MFALLGEHEATRLLNALQNTEAVTSIRINHDKWTDESLPLFDADSLTSVPWSDTGFYLTKRPKFTLDPLFHAGCYYVQEASSMFVEQVFRQYINGDAVTMLDLCAAPGGKSTHARSLLPAGSLLVANEVVRQRAQILAENLTKWGNPNVAVTHNLPADFASLPHFFDVMLTDVPCSGEGMFRKDAVAVSEWSEANVTQCWQRQRQIIGDVWEALKPGGLLIYSTCTFNTRENEENIRWICSELGAEVLPLDVPSEWNITGNLLAGETFPVYRFLPHKTHGEGFFLALLRKEGDAVSSQPVTSSQQLSGQRVKSAKAGKKQPKRSDSLAFPPELLSKIDVERWESCRTILSPFLEKAGGLRVLQAGVSPGEQKGKDFIPSHALAMSNLLRRETFPNEELSPEQAIAYLRHEAIVLPPGTPRGYVLVTYQNTPLGFVKNVGNRANNLYPSEWRIRNVTL
jgi:16S rRNA C967 or C1407 C5-methylase (RsmB/RsmF family)/NOL1/NOP2/fmu family ribosome biogenesis protein